MLPWVKKSLVRLTDARRFLGSPYFVSILSHFWWISFSPSLFCHLFFGSLDDEHLVPMASNAEAVGRVGCNMIDTVLVLQKRQSGGQSCRVTASHFESNVVFRLP